MTTETKHCPTCNREQVVFHQKYTTFPGTENEVRHYHDLICSACGTAIVHEYVDETPQTEKRDMTKGET